MNNVCMSFMRQVYETENNLLTSFMITVLEIIYCQHEITIRCVMSGVFDMADGRQQCPSHQLYGKVKDHLYAPYSAKSYQ